MTPNTRIPVTDKLRASKLWSGSMLDLVDRYGGGLTAQAITTKLASMARCDDRTPAENELMLLLIEAMEEAAPV